MRFVRVYFLSLALAVGMIAIAISASSVLESAKILLMPGMSLWQLSNWLCPPFGERCFLASESQGSHHLWGLICYVIGWQIVFGVALLLRARHIRSQMGEKI